nr:RNA polymerase sigma factor [candidate division Zixibacteria bacterium]
MKHLWKMAVDGDARAEKELFEILRERFRVIAGLILRKEDAEDIAHETCLSVHENYKSLGYPYEYNAWAQKILKNKMATFLKRKQMINKLIAPEIDGDVYIGDSNIAPNPDILRILLKCLGKVMKLNRRYARALNLVQQGYNTEEICDRMQITRDNLYVILWRARNLLNDCIFEGKNEKRR